MAGDETGLLDDAERHAGIDLIVAIRIVERELDTARIDHGPVAVGGFLDLLVDIAQGVDLDLCPAGELAQPSTVVRGRDEDAARAAAIAAGAARFLGIGFQRGGRGEVDDEAHVRFVDPHAESDGGAHHPGLPGHEAFLVAGAGALVEAGVIGNGLHATIAQGCGQRFGILARADIDDARRLAAGGRCRPGG